MAAQIINVCSRIGTGKTTFVSAFADRSPGMCLLTPENIGEVIFKHDQRFDFRKSNLFVFDEFHQWDQFALAKTMEWLLSNSDRDTQIQVVVVSQTEIEVLVLARSIGATVKTIDPRDSTVEFDKQGLIVSVSSRIKLA